MILFISALLALMPLVAGDITLAIIAQESRVNKFAISVDGHNSIGLMQVTCFDWMEIDCNKLYNPEYNIQWGEWFWRQALEYSEGDVYKALQVYNCGPDGYERNNNCGTIYADRVLYYWLPLIKSYKILED